MQLPLTPPVVLAALLVTGATEAPHLTADTAPDPVAADSSQYIADVPADAPAVNDLQAVVHATVPLPRDGACPAYEGPQCDSTRHEQYATGQAIAAMGLMGT